MENINNNILITSMNKCKLCLHNFEEIFGVSEPKDSSDLAVDEVYKWFTEIESDIKDNILPSEYYGTIMSNLVAFNLDMDFSSKNNLDSFKRRNPGFLNYKDRYLSGLINNSPNFISSYHFYKNLKFATENVVIVGANGCGKTSLANVLTKSLNASDGIVIPAQKFLILPTFSSILNYKSSKTIYDVGQKVVRDDKISFDASKGDSSLYSLLIAYGKEYRDLISLLLAERFKIRNAFCNKFDNDENVEKSNLHSNLDTVFEIWNLLIGCRTIKCDDDNNIILQHEADSYPAYKMSDGERIILYLVGKVLLAPEKALIIVDEPEMYLHKSIVNKLWDILEQKRQDCVFIYFTHDLQFASSRNSEKYWMKSYSYPSEWEIERIYENEIPEELFLTLLGSSKKILFCEGKKGSLDRNIFEILFPNYTITPVSSCKDVINYTRAYNKVSNVNSEAIGIIDRDFREQEQLDKFKNESIYSYDVAEIENLFLTEDFIKEFALYKKEDDKFEEIKEAIFNRFEQDKESQVSFYLCNKINYYFSESHVDNGNDKGKIIQNYEDFQSKIKIEDWYTERLNEINKIISDKNYEEAILVYNNKGLHSIVENKLGIKQYSKKALHFLRDTENNNGICEVLRSLFPKEINK